MFTMYWIWFQLPRRPARLATTTLPHLFQNIRGMIPLVWKVRDWPAHKQEMLAMASVADLMYPIEYYQ